VNRLLRLAIMAGCAGVFALAVHSDLPLCPLAGSFGIPCPGCGLTRATLALLHGDVRGALHFHPLVLLLTPLVVLIAGTSAWNLLRAPGSPARRQAAFSNGRNVTVLATVLLALTLSVWLARFAGYFGGPVPVTSMRDWLMSRHP
jgi:hypothetical protein